MSHAEPPETESRKRTKLTTKKWKKMVPVSVSSGSKVHNLVADNNLEGLKKHLGTLAHYAALPHYMHPSFGVHVATCGDVPHACMC